jgi:hypothetical protein
MKITARLCYKQNMMDLVGLPLNVLHSKIIIIFGLVGYIYLFWTYCPRDADFFKASKEAFIQWFQAEVQEAAHYEGWFVFNYLSWVVNYILRD